MRRVLIALALVALTVPATAEWNNIRNLKVAVLDLQSRVGEEQIDTRTLSEMLLVNLVDRNAFQIVERTLIARIIDEQQFQISDFSAREIAQIGTLAGANKIIAGSISRIGDTYFVIIKGIDTATGIIDLSDQVSSRTAAGLVQVFPILAERLVRKALGEQVAAYEPDAPVAATRRLAGSYAVGGRNPDGSEYRGTVEITEAAGVYTVVWQIGSQVYRGHGTREGDRLTIDWGDATPVIYTIRPSGELDGIWAAGAGSETLTPR